MNVALSRSFRKDAVTLTEHPFIPFDNEDDSLLFEKLQEQVLAHYPNPERKGCPDPAVLRNLIDNPSDVTLAALNDLHVFKCAECTRLLMELREKKKQSEVSE
jgi:hypothetical protein